MGWQHHIPARDPEIFVDLARTKLDRDGFMNLMREAQEIYESNPLTKGGGNTDEMQM